ncbi:MAG: Ger(x)C family spore germination protein [Clostridia bacterium]|nr:Ger(x)C family spore germination protein [Clostridia bacterium]
MKSFRRIFSGVVALMCLVSFASCEKAGTELSDLMIIQGIGVDYKDGLYTVTVEILNNEQSGSPNGDSVSENKTKIYSMQGETVSDALRLLTTKSGNLPLFAHNRVVVINENLNEKTIADVLEFFVRNYDSRASQLLCVSKGKTAEEIIRAKLFKDTVKSEILENLLTESYNRSLVPRVRVIDGVNALQNKCGGLCIPAVGIMRNGENEDYELLGCAVYDENGIISGYLSNEEAEGMAFITDDFREGFLTQELYTNEFVSIVINKSKTKYDVFTENGRLKYRLTIDVSCDLDEVSVMEKKKSDPEILRDIKLSVAQGVSQRVEKTLDALQGPEGADCIMYYKLLQLENPRLFKTVENNWHDVFSSAQTQLRVNVTIRRAGEEILKDNETV